MITLGNHYSLDFFIDETNAMDCFNRYEWKPYNPLKESKRYGLSLTSLDGKMEGVPDLDSLYEYNKNNKTNYREMDFNKPTELFYKIDGLSTFLDPISHLLGRSHILKLEQGGFFPPHRDLDPETFRLIVLINKCESPYFNLFLNGDPLKLERHILYFLNTRMEHSVFSYERCIFGVFNIKVCGESLDFLRANLSSK